MALSRAIQKAFCLGPLRVNGLDLMLAVRYYNDVMRERNTMSEVCNMKSKEVILEK